MTASLSLGINVGCSTLFPSYIFYIDMASRQEFCKTITICLTAAQYNKINNTEKQILKNDISSPTRPTYETHPARLEHVIIPHMYSEHI